MSTKETIIKTTDGDKSISQLINVPFTAVVKGESSASTDKGFFSLGLKPIFIVTMDNWVSIRTTFDHSFVKIGSNPFEEIMTKLSDLRVGDVLELESLSDNGVSAHLPRISTCRNTIDSGGCRG